MRPIFSRGQADDDESMVHNKYIPILYPFLKLFNIQNNLASVSIHDGSTTGKLKATF